MVVVDVWKADALEPVCYSKREVEKRASVKVAHKKCLLLPFLRRRRQKDKGRRENSFSKTPPTPPLAKRARMKTARVWMRKHPIYAFILSLPSFFSLSHASSSSPASRASQLREKKHRVSQQPGVQITRNTTLKRAVSRRKKKRSRT